MFAKAEIAKTWSRWRGVYVLALMLITATFRFSALASGLFVGFGTLAAAVVITPGVDRRGRVWVWVLASIVLGVFVGWWASQSFPGWAQPSGR